MNIKAVQLLRDSLHQAAMFALEVFSYFHIVFCFDFDLISPKFEDDKGVVMIWNALGDHLTVKQKWDYPLINGAVRDIAWTFDNERVAVVGEG